MGRIDAGADPAMGRPQTRSMRTAIDTRTPPKGTLPGVIAPIHGPNARRR